MPFQRIVMRELPDGRTCKVYPFHISLEGMESQLLCRDDSDYDHLEKSVYIAALKTNCLVIIAIAMSNHAHAAVLATDLEQAASAGELIKKRHSQYLRWKYGDLKILSRTDLSVKYLDSEWYVRNALAYIARNALDTGSRIEDYPWSGYRGMFVQGRCPAGIRKVAEMSRREREAIFRTHTDLSHVPWLVNSSGQVEPASACDHAYLESAFAHDQAFFLKTIGTLNAAEMQQKLVLSGRERQTDTEMYAIISHLADKWYHKDRQSLTPEVKASLIPYLYRSYKTTVPQLARCLSMSRELVEKLIPSRRR